MSTYCHTKGPAKGSVVSTPQPIKLLSLAFSSRHLDSNQTGGCVCEERTLRRSQTGLALLGLNCKASKCSGAGTGDLGVLLTQETSSIHYDYTKTYASSYGVPGKRRACSSRFSGTSVKSASRTTLAQEGRYPSSILERPNSPGCRCASTDNAGTPKV